MPVKVERTGNRPCFTDAVPDSPELGYVASNTDVRGGRHIALTSGIDGLYPANIRGREQSPACSARRKTRLP